MRGRVRPIASRSSMLAAVIALTCLGTLGVSSPATAAVPPSFANFAAPAPLGQDAGEPSIGVDWATGAAMMQAGVQTLRVTGFNFSTGTATWANVGSTITSTLTLDPILFTDHRTNRTFVSELSANCSLMAFSDNDGASWTQNPIGCGPGLDFDHQTVGGGPFAAPLTGTVYPDTVYECAQGVVSAGCALSVNGGLTFGPNVPMYSLLTCGGLHGHLKAAPDGTVYVANEDCGGQQGVAVSTDNGVTWNVRTVPGSTTQDESDPSVGIGSGGAVYLGWANGNGHPEIAVSHDRGQTWSSPVDVGSAFGIQNVQFPSVVAGDDTRAAFAFLGTPTGGNDQAASFGGVWHLYVAATYDGGATWSTVDATPNDPVQRGCIWLGGGSNACRNLLDFMDVTIDATGHVVVGYADGCTGACVTGGTNTRTAVATIAYQSGGDPLIG